MEVGVGGKRRLIKECRLRKMLRSPELWAR